MTIISELQTFKQLLEIKSTLDELKKNPETSQLFKHKEFYDYKINNSDYFKLNKNLSKKFLNNLTPEKKELFYKKIAEVAKRITQIDSNESAHSLGFRLANFHRDDPLVLQAIIEFIDDQFPSLSPPTIEKQGESLKITTGDPYFTECTIHSLDTKNSLVALAYQAFVYVTSQAPFSDNYPRKLFNLPDDVQKMLDYYSGWEKRLNEMRQIVNYTNDNLTPQQRCNFCKILTSYHNFKRIPVKNCHELTASAFVYLLKEKRTDINIECFSIGEGDHVFLVLGRKRGSDPTDPSTWGSDAIVIDIWSRQIYPASKIPEFLMDYKGHDFPTAKVRLQPFDPSVQYLGVLSSNILSVEEFQKKSAGKWPDIQKLLEEFYALPQGKEQLSKAREIIDRILKEPVDVLLNELRFQMLYLCKNNPREREAEAFNKAIQSAAEKNNITVLKEAIESGVTPSFDSFRCATDAAVQSGNLDILRLTLDAGAIPPDSFKKRSFSEAANNAIGRNPRR